jgi:hypothetical protein
MISRSESVNRTVVDLSLSFLINIYFYSAANFVSLLMSNQGMRRQPIGIAPVSPCEEFSLIFSATNGNDVEMFVERERTSPVEQRSP